MTRLGLRYTYTKLPRVVTVQFTMVLHTCLLSLTNTHSTIKTPLDWQTQLQDRTNELHYMHYIISMTSCIEANSSSEFAQNKDQYNVHKQCWKQCWHYLHVLFQWLLVCLLLEVWHRLHGHWYLHITHTTPHTCREYQKLLYTHRHECGMENGMVMWFLTNRFKSDHVH